MKVILFDIDGTLISTGDAAKRAFDTAFKALFGVAPCDDGVVVHGSTDQKIHREIAAATLGRALKPVEAADLMEQYLEGLATEIAQESQYRVLPGVLELLPSLCARSDVLVGLQTGNVEQAAGCKLAHGKLDGFFSFGGFGSDSEERAELVNTAIRRARERSSASQFSLQDVFLIGDSPQDIQAGKAAGVNTIGVATGVYSRQRLNEEDPNYLLDSLLDRHTLREAFRFPEQII